MQTNDVIYLPVVVKGATRVGGNVRQGLPANTTHSPNAGRMLCQRSVINSTIMFKWDFIVDMYLHTVQLTSSAPLVLQGALQH